MDRKIYNTKGSYRIFRRPWRIVGQKVKGLNPNTLSEPWKELVGVIHRYITCDG
jgi:hypothetical protein